LEVSRPVFSVVVASYNGRGRIDMALASLRAQDLTEPYEVIVVDSGTDDCAAYVKARYPEVRVIHCGRRLWPGAARNRGVVASTGRYIAFLPDDGVARPDWLRMRLAAHRAGHSAVAGAIINGRPGRPIAAASHYLEYSALIPSRRILAQQRVPHCLSYERSLFERLGPFPEGTRTGEDTLFNERCLAAGVQVGYEPRAQLAHRGPTRLGPYLRHQYEHGIGLARCVRLHGHRSAIGAGGQGAAAAFARIFLAYPARRWTSSVRRIARGRPRALPAFLALAPLTWAGLLATSAGAWAEWRQLDRLGPPPSTAPAHRNGATSTRRWDRARIYLTFDDGPDPHWTPRILDELGRIGAKASFFMVGSRAVDFPEVAAEVLERGHRVELHCMRHFEHLGRAHEEIEADTRAALRELSRLGARPARWRPPGGVCTERTREVARAFELELTGWSADPGDWRGHSVDRMLEILERQLRVGSVVVMHDGIGARARRAGCVETLRLIEPLVALARSLGAEPTALPVPRTELDGDRVLAALPAVTTTGIA
jgi:peptidoglycan/xylan/chitin deacetylase (PgdA/CDA1 family)/GT2 family glycosyltransferase